MEKVHIALIRHSVTKWNEENRIQGQQDSPLTEYGVQLARSWIPYIKPGSFDAVITSDLGRAIDTARIVTDGYNIPLFKNSGLREQDWGQWTSLCPNEIETKYPGQLQSQVMKGWDFRPPEGESRSEMVIRVTKALEDELRNIIKTTGNNCPKVLAVIHEGVLKALTYSLSGHDFMPGSNKLLKKRRLHWLTWDGSFAIDRLNDNL